MKFMLFFFPLAVFIGCSDEEIPVDNTDENQLELWSIPLDEITGSDTPFPFAQNPSMVSVEEIKDLNDSDMVVLVSFQTTVNAYPFKYIAPFEVVNDALDGVPFAISFCPVTESIICTENKHGDASLSSVASGYRQKANLIVKDLNSDSYWTQMLIQYVRGPYVNQKPKTLPMLETTWKTVKTYFPHARVFNEESISSKNTQIKKEHTDFGPDERVYGILKESDVSETSVSIIGSSSFDDKIGFFSQLIGTQRVLVLGSQKYEFINAFETEITASFTPIQDKFPIIMKDESNSEYNVFGVAVSGANIGQQLKAPRSYKASWWAWQDFYSNFDELN